MFYTNFEVLRTSWFRQRRVDAWARSLRDGVERNRWGDAPLRALTLGLYARPEQLVHLNSFRYLHGRASSGGARSLTINNTLNVNFSRRIEKGEESEDYFLGVCMGEPGWAAKLHKDKRARLANKDWYQQWVADRAAHGKTPPPGRSSHDEYQAEMKTSVKSWAEKWKKIAERSRSESAFIDNPGGGFDSGGVSSTSRSQLDWSSNTNSDWRAQMDWAKSLETKRKATQMDWTKSLQDTMQGMHDREN